MDVVLEDGSKFGTLKDVMETGANDVYVVEDTKGEEILLPAIRECILDVDVEKKCNDHSSDERININEFSCFNPVSGDD